MSDHVLLFPEGDHSQRRHAHTECVRPAREAGRLPCRSEWKKTQPRRGWLAFSLGSGTIAKSMNTRRVPSGWCSASRSAVCFFITARRSAVELLGLLLGQPEVGAAHPGDVAP